LSQSISAFSILPINQDTIPKEGSKGLPLSVSWPSQRIANDGTMVYSINLLQQFQTGQFTSIQAVWIDNTTNAFAVQLIALETGEIVRCPAFAQGMFPLATSVAPVFNLVNLIANQTGLAVNLPGSTRLIFFNTPQRYFVSSDGVALKGEMAVTSVSQIGAGSQVVINAATLGATPGTNLFLRLLAFRLQLLDLTGGGTGNGFAGNDLILASLVHSGFGTIFDYYFNVSAATFGLNGDTGMVTLPEPAIPGSTTPDEWLVSLSATPAAGFQIVFNYWYDWVILK